MRDTTSFTFSRGNLGKVLTIPIYVLGWIVAWVVPRSANRWVFGSGIGPREGALALAEEVRRRLPEANIAWIVGSDNEERLVSSLGFAAIRRRSFGGFWHTLRSRFLVVTHGLGDVNRYAVFRGLIINLWHGPPMKKLHLDSEVTTAMSGGTFLTGILRRMYRTGAQRVSLMTAGSATAAQRLRSAFRVQPGIVEVTGDPRLDTFCLQLQDSQLANEARTRLLEAAGVPEERWQRPVVLYAPTWRDGADDPVIDRDDERRLQDWADTRDVTVLIRSHPLGKGTYDALTAGQHSIYELPPHVLPDLSNVLVGVDVLVTDYSSAAFDFALTGRPIVWFAPDLDAYAKDRGLYEPYEVTTEGQWCSTWSEVIERVDAVVQTGHPQRLASMLRTKRLAERFHKYSDGRSAERVLDMITIVARPRAWVTSLPSVFFESFYGRLATCNPAAIDQRIATEYPDIRRLWSVTSETVEVPPGAVPVLVGGALWHAARRYAPLLIVNDWLRFNFRRRRGQFVLQTWHGTPLKRLALQRDNVSLRSRLAIRRESRRWSALLSQNSHCTRTLSESYGYTGPVLEVGYPRNDRLANVVAGGSRIPVARRSARERLALPHDKLILLYAPTWREHYANPVDTVGLHSLGEALGEEWMILARGHSRMLEFQRYEQGANIVDVSVVPDVNDLIIAADFFVTDYSSLMFDVSVARVPTLFLVPDLDEYVETQRGLTLPLNEIAPGPLVSSLDDLVNHLRDREWIDDYSERQAAWNERFNARDDGRASERVVQELKRTGVLPIES